MNVKYTLYLVINEIICNLFNFWNRNNVCVFGSSMVAAMFMFMVNDEHDEHILLIHKYNIFTYNVMTFIRSFDYVEFS